LGEKEPDSQDFLVESEEGFDIRKPLFGALASAEYPILMMRPHDVSLEDVFLELTDEKKEEKVTGENETEGEE